MKVLVHLYLLFENQRASISGRILVSTAVANVGIDNHLVIYVVSIGWSRDLCIYFQQRGRRGRDPNDDGECLQISDVQSYLYLMFGIFNNNDGIVEDKDAISLAGVNWQLPLWRKRKRKINTNKWQTKIIRHGRTHGEELQIPEYPWVERKYLFLDTVQGLPLCMGGAVYGHWFFWQIYFKYSSMRIQVTYMHGRMGKNFPPHR